MLRFMRLIASVRRRADQGMRAFDQVVLPILSQAVVDGRVRAELIRALRIWCVKGNQFVGSYADMAGIPYDTELGILGNAFSRLYDDLLDDGGREGLGNRLGVLFAGGEFRAVDDLEVAMLALYREVEDRLERPRSDPIYGALGELHRLQCMTQAGQGTDLPPDELLRIELDKGAHAAVVLFALARRDMADDEAALIRRVGGTLQLLDDYLDYGVDQGYGRRSPAIDLGFGFRRISAMMRSDARLLRERYGSGSALFCTQLDAFRWIALLGHFRARLSSGRRPIRFRRITPLRLILERGPSVAISVD